MAINPTAIWRVRVGGSNNNGGGFDAAISGAGTDYSQQDSAQLSLTDLTSTNSTTITSATGGFTTAMIGNAIRINSGTGATVGWYFILGRTDTNTITVDRVSGTYTAGVASVGGAVATWQSLMNDSNAAGNKAVAGNIIWIRGSGSDSPSSADYTTTGFIASQVAGNTTDGYIKICGENGRPWLRGNGLAFYNCSRLYFENLYFDSSSNSNGSYGIVNLNTNNTLLNCVFDLGTNYSHCGLQVSGGGNALIYCEIKATAGQSFSSQCYGINVSSYGLWLFGCNVHDVRDVGIYEGNTASTFTCVDTLISDCKSDGVYVQNTGTVSPTVIRNCTIDGNSGHGIAVATRAALGSLHVVNSNITNHSVSGKKGINVATGTTASNDRTKRFMDYNNFYGNDGNYGTISAGSHDTTLDPQYTGAGSNDFSVGTNLKAIGFPSTLRGSATPTYIDIGCAQRQEAGGGGGGGAIGNGNLNGGLL